MAVIDSQGDVIGANSAFIKLNGRNSGDIPIVSLDDVIHPEDYKAVSRLMSELDNGRHDSFDVETRINNGAGRSTWCRLSVSTWTDSDDGQRLKVATLTDISNLIRKQRELRAMSMIDELTGLFNRRGFMTLASKRLRHADRTGRSLLLMFADVDGMKWINDNLGHNVGDQALEEFAQVLTRTLRRSDVAARIGGDEFVAVMLDTDEGHAIRVVDRITATLEAVNSKPGRPYLLSCCMGITRYAPGDRCSLEELVKRADEKMYQHKIDREDSSFKAKPIQ